MFPPNLTTCLGGIVNTGFEQFIKERQYLSNVSPATVEWYRQSLRWLAVEAPNEDQLKDFVMRMREKGLKPTGCNNRIRAVNAYLKWTGSPLRVLKLKEPQIVLPTFTTQQVSILVKHKPKGSCPRRLHLLAMILLDTGCRISEALDLRLSDCDFDNLLIVLNGKGRKQRRVPFSFELRKVLFRYTREMQPHSFVLATRRGCRLDRHIMARDMRILCKRLGFDPPARILHSFRHTFALNYLRRGGSVFHLQKVLGHSSLEMTRRYVNLITEDLQEMHQRVSLLAA
jgi:integrase/recombinase XerD